ncbi:MAG: asparagine synthase (glutamine-hydrolyzing) [Planctomycetales bacterium]|nr:asparagine synthase (glutamine-hydrolyzing) [Planctomycetales bacterium]
MCGIAGFEARSGDSAVLTESLLGSLRNRGPDGDFFDQRGQYGLVQTRLAVIDLSERVHYPMPNETGDLWLIFNGEIYGYLTLRKELEKKGHRFKTNCDAEVVVHGYEEWGLKLFPRLNGMFALAIVDEIRNEITLARDASGIKPLVRTTGGRFAFSSDVMALVSAGLSAGKVDPRSIAEFGAFHYVPLPGTGISDIDQVEPGTAVVRRADGSEMVRRWTPLRFDGPPEVDDVDPLELSHALLDAVSRQLVADVEVGIFLSGGVDSSLLAALAVEAGAMPRAFTISFRGHGDYDESERAARLASSLGIPHQVAEMSYGFTEAVESVATAYDVPFADSSALPMLAISRVARSGVTVALSGTGGDDLFAGYYRHRAHKLRSVLALLPRPLLKRLGEIELERGGERSDFLKLAKSYLVRIARAGTGDDFEQYLALAAAMSSDAGLDVLREDALREPAWLGVAERLGLGTASSGSVLRELQRFEMRTYVPGDLLTKEDRASMAFGLEARVPLLDETVVRLAERMPDSQKISLRAGKLPLRNLAREKLPPAGRLGRKRGFAVPLQGLFAGSWRQEARDWLTGSDSTLVDGKAAAELLDANRSRATDLWALSALMGWESRLNDCRAAKPPPSG